MIHNEYGIQSVEAPTLPSMSLKVFRTYFYEPKNGIIVNLSNYVDSYIRKAYYGGDVYSPILEKGYLYDVNSLYPYAMTFDLPVGNPRTIYGFIELEKFLSM